MTELLSTIHEWFAYLVFLIVLGTAVIAFRNAKDASEFRAGPYVLATVLLDVLVTIGLVLYGVRQAWNFRPEIAYIHPTMAVAALAVAHIFVGRAKGTQMAVDAHRTAGRGLLLALAFITAAIGIASAPPIF